MLFGRGGGAAGRAVRTRAAARRYLMPRTVDDQSDARKRKISTPRPTTMRMRARRRLMRPPDASGFSCAGAVSEVVAMVFEAVVVSIGAVVVLAAAVVVVTGTGVGA